MVDLYLFNCDKSIHNILDDFLKSHRCIYITNHNQTNIDIFDELSRDEENELKSILYKFNNVSFVSFNNQLIHITYGVQNDK